MEGNPNSRNAMSAPPDRYRQPPPVPDARGGSLCRFVQSDASLRLDKADVLAEYLGLGLVKRKAT
jgi:hypothetical protein